MPSAIPPTQVLLQTCQAAGSERCGTVVAEPVLSGGGDGQVDHPEAGRWLLLREAVREIGSLEYLYRLARQGKLQSRDDPDGQVEVWVADRDCAEAAPTRSLDTGGRMERTLVDEPDSPEFAHQLASLIAPLIESHERHFQIARENGVLSERLVGLERDLQMLREQALRGMEEPHELAPTVTIDGPGPTRERSQPRAVIAIRVAIPLGILLVLLGLSIGWITQRPF